MKTVKMTIMTILVCAPKKTVSESVTLMQCEVYKEREAHFHLWLLMHV